MCQVGPSLGEPEQPCRLKWHRPKAKSDPMQVSLASAFWHDLPVHGMEGRYGRS